MQLEKSLLHVLRYYRLHKLFSIACEKIWKLHNMIIASVINLEGVQEPFDSLVLMKSP